MKITFNKGNKTEGDRFILIEADKESISMMDIASMVNQFALNELIIIDEKPQLSRDNHFWFTHLMKRVVEDAKNNLDWITCEEEKLQYLTERPYFIKKSMLTKFFRDRDGSS